VPMKALNQDNNKIQPINERNDIRSLLKKNFTSINVHLFKQPANPEHLKSHAELPQELIDSEFINTVNELRDQIAEQTKEPRRFNGVVLTGSRLCGVLTQIVDIVNKGVDVNVPSVFRAMEQETILRIVKVTLETFTKLVSEFELPLSETDFKKNIDDAKGKALEIYDAKLMTCTLKDEVTTGKENFNKKSEDIIDRAAKENITACWAYAKEMVLKEVQTLKTDYVKWCTERIPSEDKNGFQGRYSEMQLEAAKSLAAKLRHLPHILSDPKFESLMKVEQEKVDVVVQVQEAKNQAALNELQVQMIMQETEKMRKQHLETRERLLKKISDSAAKANRDLQAFADGEDNKYSDKLSSATTHHKKREAKLIERAEELLEIKRQNAKQIETLETELLRKERGYLEKQGNRRKQYQVRWFEVTPQSGSKYSELRYYGKQEDNKAKGIILLDSRITIDYVDKAKDFCIHAPRRDYNLRASTSQDARAWVTSLNELKHTGR